ncbi:hypothetical protein ACHAWF_013639 [Thalassiosira exigua]
MRSAVREYIESSGHSLSIDRHEGGEGSRDIWDSEGQTTAPLHQGPPPIKLVGILATTAAFDGDLGQSHDEDAYGNEIYSEQIATCCSADGILYEPWRVPPTLEALERAIVHANERLDVHGVLVFYPISDRLETGVYYRSMDDYFRDLVACHKDVEGYCRKGLRIQRPGEESGNTEVELGPIYPCTALAVYKILESFHASDEPFENISITIINRSEVLGLPLATMLSNQGATVYSVNVDSILRFLPNGKVRREHADLTVENCVRKSSVVVSGVPSNRFKVPTEWIPDRATLINVAAETNFEEESLGARDVTYVPHVGRVTVAALEYNLMSLHKNYHSS